MGGKRKPAVDDDEAWVFEIHWTIGKI